MPILIEPIKIETLLQEVKFLAKELGYFNNLKLSVDVDEQISVMADNIKLKKLLLGLLLNKTGHNEAVKLSFKHQVSDKKIRISLQHLVSANHSNNFEAISKTDNLSNKEHYSEIDLAICKELTYLIDSELQCESYEGTGSYIWFDLIIASENPDLSDQMQLNHEKNSQIRLRNGEKTYNIILYVEDNSANMVLIRQVAKRLKNVKLIEAVNGNDGVQLALNLKPDTILMDIDLPDISGFDALISIKKSKILQDSKVIAISANAMAADIEKGKKAGFDDYLTKPIDIQQLISIIS